jgi:hypothetical protein
LTTCTATIGCTSITILAATAFVIAAPRLGEDTSNELMLFIYVCGSPAADVDGSDRRRRLGAPNEEECSCVDIHASLMNFC